MSSRLGLILLSLVSLSSLAWSASVQYTCTLTDAQQEILTEELTYRHLTQTPQQAIQQLCNRELRSLGHDQEERTVQDFNNMIRITTPGGITNAESALAAGITPPTITQIDDQTTNVGQVLTLPIVATNPYPNDLALTFRVTGLPPGMSFGNDVNGAPQLSGKVTTAGTFNVSVEAYNVVAVKATELLTVTVNP